MSTEHQDHISGDLLERFFLTELPREEMQRIVRHLLTNCPQCLETAALVGQRCGIFTQDGELDLAEPPQATDSMVDIIARSPSGDRGRTDAARPRAAPGNQPPGRARDAPARHERLARIQSEPRFHHRGLFDRMLDRSLELARNEPRSGIELVTLALAILDLLPQDRYQPALLNDFRVAGLAALANARRMASFFELSKQAIEQAWEHLEEARAILSKRRICSASRRPSGVISASSIVRPAPWTGRSRSTGRSGMTTAARACSFKKGWRSAMPGRRAASSSSRMRSPCSTLRASRGWSCAPGTTWPCFSTMRESLGKRSTSST